MKKQHLFALWGALFVLCAALGFIPQPGTALQILMTILSIVFFLPGGLLLHLSRTSGDRTIAVLVRNFSAASLILTAVLLILKRHHEFWPCIIALHKIGAITIPATFQMMPRSMVAPTMETSEYTIRNTRLIRVPSRNSTQRWPYRPQPRMVEKAKQHSTKEARTEANLP